MHRTHLACSYSLAASAFLLLGDAVVAQGPEWANGAASGPEGDWRLDVAYDPGRGCAVAYGGGGTTTWEFDGLAWRGLTPAQSPPATMNNAMVHDPSRGTIVMIGGVNEGGLSELAETWEWNGSTWSQRAAAPTLLSSLLPWAIKRDAVWHGGVNPGLLTTGTAGTWQLVGSTWVARSSFFAHGPWTYVPLTGRTYTANQPLSSSGYSWDGTAWTPVTSNWPAGRRMTGFAWDPARSQFVALSVAIGPYDDSWTHYGTLVGAQQIQWSSVSNLDAATNSYVPPVSLFTPLVYDAARARMLNLLDLRSGAWTSLPDVFELPPNGAPGPWTRRQPMTPPPTSRTYSDQSHDPALGRTVLFGGAVPGASGVLGDTWSFDGRQWTNHGTNLGASPRVLPRLAHLANQGTVMFGGATSIGGPFLDDTNVWNGTSWTTLFSFVRPSPRYGHDMVTVGSGATSIWLFGGFGGSYLNDTWRLGGNGWQQVGTFGPTPPVRSSHRIAYDARRSRLVLFGGQGASANFLGDTWELTLGPSPTWTQVSPAQSPSPRWNHAMEYDPARGVVVMFGGYGPPSGGGAATFRNDVWEYNGVTWRQRSVSGTPPSAREAAGMSWHPSLQRFVVQGGYSPTLPYGPTDTFFYRAPIDVPGQGMVNNPVALRTRTVPVAGQNVTLEFANPSTFGWLLVTTEPDTVGVPLFPDPMFCGAGRIHGPGGVISDAWGNPGTASFYIPPALVGTALTCQGIALTTSMCFHFTDPLLLTVAAP